MKANVFTNKNFNDHVTISEIIPLKIVFTDLTNSDKHVVFLAFMVGYASSLEANLLSHHLTLYSQKPQQSVRQRRPFANDNEANTHKRY